MVLRFAVFRRLTAFRRLAGRRFAVFRRAVLRFAVFRRAVRRFAVLRRARLAVFFTARFTRRVRFAIFRPVFRLARRARLTVRFTVRFTRRVRFAAVRLTRLRTPFARFVARLLTRRAIYDLRELGLKVSTVDVIGPRKDCDGARSPQFKALSQFVL